MKLTLNLVAKSIVIALAIAFCILLAVVTDQPRRASLVEQRECAEAANSFLARVGGADGTEISHTVHYNTRLRRCLVRSKSMVLGTLIDDVTDVMENRTLGANRHPATAGMHCWLANGDKDVPCKSDKEFDEWARAYMEE